MSNIEMRKGYFFKSAKLLNLIASLPSNIDKELIDSCVISTNTFISDNVENGYVLVGPEKDMVRIKLCYPDIISITDKIFDFITITNPSKECVFKIQKFTGYSLRTIRCRKDNTYYLKFLFNFSSLLIYKKRSKTEETFLTRKPNPHSSQLI